jgi:protein-L-isoaspartate(D-aspartate) O-methyltransferase
MTEALELRPTHQVLESGAGGGYQTAILSELVEWVYSVERLAPLAERARSTLEGLGVSNVTYHTGDGTLGWPAENSVPSDHPAPARFDRILCAAAGPTAPEAWTRQLAEGGRMVLPIGAREAQQLVRIDKAGDALHRHRLCDVRFVPLIGRAGWPSG